MAIAARAGAPVPRVETAEQFKPLLNSAKSLAYPPEGTVGAQVKKIAADFGLSEQVLAKTKPQAEALVNPSL
jgi:2-keto-3-deoxy-L-rhamnonate aldolase RhmA